MAKILVLYYSMYGHIETMAQRWRKVRAASRALKSSSSACPTDAGRRGRKAGAKLDQAAPIATVEELPDTTPSSSARRPASATCARRCATSRPDRQAVGERRPGRQGRQRLHLHVHAARRTGNHDHLVSHHPAASRHDRRRRPLFLPGDPEDERNHRRLALRGGTLAGADNSRQPSENELKIARFQGAHVANVAKKQSA